jgi:hypothetical protein
MVLMVKAHGMVKENAMGHAHLTKYKKSGRNILFQIRFCTICCSQIFLKLKFGHALLHFIWGYFTAKYHVIGTGSIRA